MADLQWVLAVVDKVSGPAKAAAAAMSDFRGSMDKADKAIAGVANGKLDKIGDALMGKITSGAQAAGRAIATFAASAGAEFAKLALEVGKFAIDDVVEGENLDLALKTIVGDAKEFEAIKDRISKLGNFLGQNPDDVERSLTKLVSKGHSAAEAFKILQGASDLKTLGNDANALVDAFTQVDDKGKLSAKAVASLAGAGIDPNRFREILGSAIGSSGDLQTDIENAIKAGTLDTATLQAAALKTITQMTGKALGGLAEEQTHTIGGLLNTLKTVPDRLFDALDESGFAEPLRRGLEAITNALNPETESGKKVVAGLQQIGDAVGRLIDMVTGDGSDVGDWVQGLADVFSTVADVIVVVSDLVGDFVDEFKTGLDAILKPMGKFGGEAVEMDDVIKALSKTFKFLGAVVGVTVGLIIQVASWIIEAVVGIGEGLSEFVDWWDHLWRHDVPDAFTDAWDSIVETFDDTIDTFTDFGTDIVEGIEEGIIDAWDSLKGTWNNLVDSLPAAVADKLKIQSPSRVMMELGGYAAEGFAVGVENGAPQASNAFADLVSFDASNAGGSSSVASSSRGVIVSFGDIIVGGSADDPKAAARSILDEIERGIESTFGNLAMQMGAA